MVTRWRNALVCSTTLHIGVVATLVLLGYSLVNPPPPQAVLQFVSDARSELGRLNAPSSSAVSFHVPKPVLPPASTAQAQASEPEPEAPAAPSVRTRGKNEPQSPTREPTATVPTPTKAKAQTITKTDFDRYHAKPASTPIRTAATPRIDGGSVAADLRHEAAAAKASAFSSGGASLPLPYIEMLEAALGAELERIGGFTPGLRANAEFHIMPDGQLVRARLLIRSGDDLLDAAIIRSIEGFRAPPRPANVDEVHRTTFTTRARE